MTTLGYGDIVPKNNSIITFLLRIFVYFLFLGERIFASIMALVSGVIFAFSMN